MALLSEPLRTPRYGAVACAGDLVYLVGGNNGNMALSSVEILDPIRRPGTPESAWVEADALHLAREYHSAAAVSRLVGPRRFIVAGGQSGDLPNGVPFPELGYGGRWDGASPTDPMMLPIARAAAAGSAGAFYFTGGGKASSDVWRVTSIRDAPTKVAPLNIGRHSHAATRTGVDRLWVFGGVDAADHILDSVEVYDPASDTWSVYEHPLPTPRAFFVAVTGPDGRIYAIGGNTEGNQTLASVDVLDPLTHTWSRFPPLEVARRLHAASLGPDDKIYVIGGLDGKGNVLGSVERF